MALFGRPAMKVADVMTRGVLSLSPEDTVRKAADLMLRYNINGFPVLDRGKLVGMITQGDFLRRAETGTERHRPWLAEFFTDPGRLADEYVRAHGRAVADVMTRDVIAVAEDAPLVEAVELMENHNVKRLPVVRGDAVVGIITRVNLLRAFLMGTSKEAPPPLGDDAIRGELTAELDRQHWIPHGTIESTVQNGVVVLCGTIRDDRLRAALRVAAENIPGVKQVIDELTELDLTTVS
jgi:CBS domain-containing protein